MAHRAEITVSAGYPALGRVHGAFQVDALAVTNTLALNQDLDLDSKGDVRYRKTWNVTHMPTGWALMRDLPSQAVARAVADLLEALSFDALVTADPAQLASFADQRGLSETKSWIREQIDRSRSSKALTEKLAREARKARRGEVPTRSTKKERQVKRARPVSERKEREVDLIAMARKARSR